MIAVDTCVLVDFLAGDKHPSIYYFNQLLHEKSVVLPPTVLSEFMSDYRRHPSCFALVGEMKLLEVSEGYWLRVGHLRAAILKASNKARLGDALIAQSCIDHGVPLLTRDVDFKHYAKHGGLKLVKARGK